MTSTTPPKTIALDGPAASGKSTVGLKVAAALNYLFFDTGVMYRAIAWAALNEGIDTKDEAAVTKLAEETPIDIRPASQEDGRTSDVVVENTDITWQTRSPEVDANVSTVAAYPGVRDINDPLSKLIRDLWTPLFEEAGIRLAFEHHEHAFKVTHPMRACSAYRSAAPYRSTRQGGHGRAGYWHSSSPRSRS